MKGDVVAANLANLRQSINELKECIEKQNATVSKSEQSVKVEKSGHAVTAFSQNKVVDFSH